MELFTFPAEVRLRIYSQLLIHPDPIILEKRIYSWPARLRLGESIALFPTLLRISKKVYDEAVPLLYSKNCFHFREEDEATTEHAEGTTLALFLRQIGLQAKLIRHACITIPRQSISQENQLDADDLQDLDLARDACANIAMLELSLPFTSGFPVSATTLDLIDKRLKALPLLQNVTVNVRWYVSESMGSTDDESEEMGGLDDWDDPEGHLTAKLREREWMVHITKVPPVKGVWTDPDGRIEFDNEDDYHHYMNGVWYPHERQKEEEEEAEYYYQRQLAGYDMGYADDGGPP